MRAGVILVSAMLAAALTGPASAEVVVRGHVVPDAELPYVQAQCDTLKAREWGNSNNEWDPDPNEDAVPSGNAHRVRSLDLYMLDYEDCVKAGLS